jgi:hypothetical protein
MMKKLAGILAGLCLSVLAFGQLDITKRNVTVTQNFHVRSDTVLNAGEVAEMINDSVDLAAKQDTGLSLLKTDTITEVVTISQLSDSLSNWNTSLAKQITADDTTWWGYKPDGADSSIFKTVHAFDTDTVTASNTGTVPAYRYNYWNAKQSPLTNPVTGTGTSGYIPKFTETSTIDNSLLTVSGSLLTIGNADQPAGLYVKSSTTARDQRVHLYSTTTLGGGMQYWGSTHSTNDMRNKFLLFAANGIYFGKSVSSYAGDVKTFMSNTGNWYYFLNNGLFFQTTINSNTTNDKKWSASADYRAIWQNYSGGAYGDSVSIANNGDIYTPGLIRIGSTNAESIAATRGYVKDAINDSLLNVGQIVTKNTGNTVAITGTSTSTYGIFGNSTSGFGIYGLSASNQGVRGTSSTGYGVAGTSSSNIGVYAHSTSGAGIYGSSASHYGGYFETATNLKIVSFSKSGTNAGEVAYIDTNGYFSGGIKADANDTIFFGTDYIFGGGSIRTNSDLRTSQDIYADGGVYADDIQSSTGVIAHFEVGDTMIGGVIISPKNIIGDYTNGIIINSDSAVKLLGNATVWDDLSWSAQQLKSIGVATDLPDYDKTNLGLLFPDNDTTENIGIVGQMLHDWKQGSSIYPHVHVIQTSADTSRWKLKYRVYNRGATVPTVWSVISSTTKEYTWSTGSLHQVINFPAISMTSKTISCNIDMVIYRDPADAITGDVLLKYFDIHYEKDGLGSPTIGGK